MSPSFTLDRWTNQNLCNCYCLHACMWYVVCGSHCDAMQSSYAMLLWCGILSCCSRRLCAYLLVWFVRSLYLLCLFLQVLLIWCYNHRLIFQHWILTIIQMSTMHGNHGKIFLESIGGVLLPNMVQLQVTTSQHDCYYHPVFLIHMDINHLFNNLYKLWQLRAKY